MANTPHDDAHAMMITREVTPDGERYTLSLCPSHAAVLTNAAELAGLAPDQFVLRAIARELGRCGSIVFDLEVDGGGLVLRPAAYAQVVRGTNDPASWEYLLTMNGPATSTTRRRRRDEVAALVYGPSPASPWKGNAPWQSAPLSSQLMAGIERQLSGEASSSSGYVIPMPDTGDRGQAADADGEDDPLTTLRRDMAASRGKTLLVPSLAGGLGAGPGVSPTTSQEYMPRRWGADPPEALIELRRDVERSVLSCYGILPSLFYERAAGTALREAGRQTHANSAVPIAQLVAAQLSEALDESITLTLPRATDVATLSRAIGSLVTAGVEVGEARAIVGI